MIGKFLGKLELITDSLISTDPQYQFMPITDLEVWAKMWKFVILGEPMITGMDTSKSGFWFSIDPDTKKYRRTHEKPDWTSKERFIRIRAIDLEDYQAEVKSVLEGNPITLNHGIELSNIY